MKVQRKSRGIALLCQRHAPAALLPGKRRGTYLQEVGWVPGRVCKGAEDNAATGIRSPEPQYRINFTVYPPAKCSTDFVKIQHNKPHFVYGRNSTFLRCPQTSHILTNLHAAFSIFK